MTAIDFVYLCTTANKKMLPQRCLHKNYFTNLLAHNNISQICYCGQISLQKAVVAVFPIILNFGGNIYFSGDGTSLFTNFVRCQY